LVLAQLSGTLLLSEEQLEGLRPFLAKSYFKYESLKDEMPNLAVAARCVRQTVRFYEPKDESSILKGCLCKIDEMIEEGLIQIPKIFRLVAPTLDKEVGPRRIDVINACLIVFGMPYTGNKSTDWSYGSE
jgi:hypothetical protein